MLLNMNYFYLSGITFLLMHEMDAVRCKEWRIFPGLSFIKDDKLAAKLFILLHIPLFYWLLSEIQNDKFRVGFDYFLIVHLVMHIFYLKHKKNEFKDWISWTIISAAGLSGALDLIFFVPN